ncbi:hypothetical protein PVAP13_4NG097550 [Panicum virgatum]|uniref:TTF-type domain-containing protein n=1 Tax=Panicum virgatum TaxID=38727 RepID=A0A8T0T6L5_PANVG|nr:hypothetical protein PVAP13_4NG097550 [Panicum virgatum]
MASPTKPPAFFKPIVSGSRVPENPNATNDQTTPIDVQVLEQNATPPSEAQQARNVTTAFERDPGKRTQIWQLSPTEQDEAIRFYISEGPYQPKFEPDEYPYNDAIHRRRFCRNWYADFWWLEYSPHTKRAYCFPCFLFSKKPIGKAGSDAFTVKGFQNWKKVHSSDKCAFLTHMGQDPSSAHNYSVQCYNNLKNRIAHIDQVVLKQKEKRVADARLRLKTTIDSIRWLTFQACPFRGHDESPDSINQGNFLEMVKLLASYNKEVNDVVLQNAPKKAKYTSPDVQKEILNIYARKVQISIREEIGNSKFCIMVDESRDESKKEQMAIVVRFVNKEGIIKERFLDLIHVKDTAALTLKDSICAVLSDNNLSVRDIRGQGYDGASNMRGDECPYAYYIHCMAHQLQLALVAASREAHEVHNFFQHAISIINVVSASSKRNDELLAKQAEQIAHEIELGELDTGRVLRNIANDRSIKRFSRGDAAGALHIILTFDFVFVLVLMEKIMKITEVLCQTLQKKSIDILNAMDSVSNTKGVTSYADVTKSRNKHDNTTTLHHYKIDVFNVAIDQQLNELEDRFSSQATELLSLCASLDPRLDSFDRSKISTLVEKYYPADFSNQERAQLECQLPHFQLDVCNDPELSSLPSLADLTNGLVKLGKNSHYPMVDKLLRLVMTLPVSTATTERAFSAMKLAKTRPRNKMGDDFLRSYMIIYIEKELARKITSEDIINSYDLVGSRRGKFKLIEM